ncbi:class D beta-lactamase [Thiocystis violascens]|uniref:Beta-lactamase class D n=1 Tax=Thiocystis violascens (strain ATCC 17096 / DSM 198 / 6111) TaxID=765911 RepID=I3YD40_THIV6|nr:class D beta-lactamase [Thiocystis violascens]AFL74908.1 beta-lactamase class D [Thiocystis violascens DSM 198]
MRRLLLTLTAVLLSLPVLAEDADIAALFAHADRDGTLVLSSLRTGETFIHHDTRAQRRVSPASTFKIFNTLIALEAKAIGGANDRLAWDGQRHAFLDWNRDQTLASAFKVSCVWCYQTLARRVGAATYREAIRQAGYGALSEPFALTEFWLDGSLRISAIEQVAFMKQVVRRTLPFGPQAYDTLRDIMVVEQTPAWTLRAKTGWSTRSTPSLGWYVGYIETHDDTWVFAMHLDLRDAADLPLRAALTRAALQVKGLIE